MPTIIFAKKEIVSNDHTTRVWKAFQNAIKDCMVIAKAIAPDEKTVKTRLEVEEKKNLEGLYPSFLRYTGLSHAARYYLEEMEPITVSQWADVYYKKLQSTLLKVLAEALYGDTALHKISETTSIMSANLIDNHFMVICEILLRLVADALNEQLIKNRTSVVLGEDDSAVICIKRFVLNLKIDPDQVSKLFGNPPGKEVKISSMVRFLNQFFNRETSFINMLIFNARDINAPKQSFELVSGALEIIQKNVRAYLLVYLDLLSQALDKKPLLSSHNNLRSDMVLSFFEHVINALLAQGDVDFSNQEDKDLVEIGNTVFIEEDIKILHMFTKKANNLKDLSQKKSARHSINEIKQLFILDEQLLAIRDAVRGFVTFAELGNWIPIFFKVISPEVLSIAIDKFSKKCQTVTDRVSAYLSNSNFIAGLESLPPFEWAKLDAMNIVIRNLNSQEMKDRIYDTFNAQITGLVRVEQLLLSHKLLDGDQHIISKLMTPQLTDSGSMRKAVSASSQRRLTQGLEIEAADEKHLVLPEPGFLSDRSQSWNTKREAVAFTRSAAHSSAPHIAPSSAMFQPSPVEEEKTPSSGTSPSVSDEKKPTVNKPAQVTTPPPPEHKRCCVVS